ncbi:MAG: hypothetical protein HYV96_20880 [Opitutae bacterium]|nr:hypothetical protein [Opitutae bacterium]
MEFELKSYIAEALELARKCADGRVPFKLHGRDYAKEPLGRLIPGFKKLSDCPALVKQLESFCAERNFIAHQALASCIDPDGDFDFGTSRKEVARLAKIEKEAKSLVEAIHAEALKFRAQLDFYDMDRAQAS